MKKDSIKVAVIVDNPFRDLEGSTLIARELVRQGAQVCLVPMYEQAYDVPQFQPNVVVANYIRANNKALLTRYRAHGAAIVILDTEGNGGEDPFVYAESIIAENPKGLVDAYCLWGRDQYDAFLERAVLPSSNLELTGVPRYDLFTSYWDDYRSPQPPQIKDYVLINTNFPIVNPRFNNDTEDVIRSWIRAGIAEKFARDFATDAVPLHQRYVHVIEETIREYPDIQFVLRPHPFENANFYDHFNDFPNCKVIQTGTSLDWVRNCKALLHLNCATSIEAVMLGREALAFEWLNTPIACQKIPTEVSYPAHSREDLWEKLEWIFANKPLPITTRMMEAREKYICQRYELDGQSAKRVAELCVRLGQHHHWHRTVNTITSCKETLRKILGYRGFTFLQGSSGGVGKVQRKGKQFIREEVISILARLNTADLDAVMCHVPELPNSGLIFNRSISGASVIIKTN